MVNCIEKNGWIILNVLIIRSQDFRVMPISSNSGIRFSIESNAGCGVQQTVNHMLNSR